LILFQNIAVAGLLLVSPFSHVGKRKPRYKPWNYFRYLREDTLVKHKMIFKGRTNQTKG